ncbi:UNVERIFIED_CONTAM: Phospholipase A1-IIgamma [Sesamum calycinum]|uniref:Phospholipase A1 n=1 Tax=Sesamum calycinum TaxID=2727403 RepID=A0AAW2Q3N8_9LAMI
MVECIDPKRWRLLSGENKWKNLLHPLDSDLQKYLIHYGAMAQATNDAFDLDLLSKYVGSSKFSRKNMLSRVGLVKGNPYKYKVVKFIYATSAITVPKSFILKSMSEDSWCKESNWMGYIAVATDEGKAALGRRDILVAWRGTIAPIEWMKDFEFPLVSGSEILGEHNNAKVHQGFLSVYTSRNQKSRFNKTSARDQVLSQLKELVEHYKDEEISITVTGHSLGGALSCLNATDIACNGHNKTDNNPNKACLVTALVYGCPLVGDKNFRDATELMKDLRILKTRNAPDIVPTVPPITVGYTPIGVELLIDSRKSKYLNPGDTYTWHNLEAGYLHTLAIQNGDKVERDLALVNKGSGALKPKYSIPFSWWCEENKGMVQNSDGSWQWRDHETDED